MAYANFSHLKEEFKDMIQYCRDLKVGDKVKFECEKQRYTVKAKSDRFLICTKPMNALKTVLYSIIDLERLVRGPNNLVFNCYEYTDQGDINQCLKDLVADEIEVSHRRALMLDVEIE